MADHENCVPVSIGFSKTVLIPSRVECRARQVRVCEREHPTSTRGISVAGTWVPCEGSGVDFHCGDTPHESVRSGEDAAFCQTVKALPMGYHEKSHKPIDHGDCQGSLHSS